MIKKNKMVIMKMYSPEKMKLYHPKKYLPEDIPLRHQSSVPILTLVANTVP